MQTHLRGCFSMRAERRLVKQEHRAGSLPKLVLDRSPHNELLALGNDACWEIGAIRYERSRHDMHPFGNIIFVSIRCPYRLPQSLHQPTLELFVKRSTSTILSSLILFISLIGLPSA